MGFLDFLKKPDMGEGLARFEADPAAVLLDVRTEEEYAQGHIPNSRSLPLDRLHLAARELRDPATPIYVYCLSGSRSRVAAAQLRRMGYRQIHDLGGIYSYQGKVVTV